MLKIQKIKVLIIDNNPAFLNVFAKLLEIKGFDVTAETLLKTGLKHLEKKSFPVVFVDAPLDNYTENQILTSLAKKHVFKNSNVFLFSSVELDEIVLNQWKKEGLYSYLKKPVDRSTIMEALSEVRSKIHDDSHISGEIQDEEATPEQVAKLNQLQKQIRELESLATSKLNEEPESAEESAEDEEATPEQVAKLNQLQKQIRELESLATSKLNEEPEAVPREEPEAVPREEPEAVPREEPEAVPREEPEAVPREEPEAVPREEPEAVPREEPEAVPREEPEAAEDEEATPEQVAKLNQLQKQIRELENILQNNAITVDSQIEEHVHVKSELGSDNLAFKNIIDDLKSLQSQFESESTHLSEIKPSAKITIEQEKLAKNKLKESLDDLSRLKNEITSFRKPEDSDVKSDDDLLTNEKKPKVSKKSSRIGTKKPKVSKKSSRIGTKKSHKTRKR